jgi:hypothetical protein
MNRAEPLLSLTDVAVHFSNRAGWLAPPRRPSRRSTA